MAGEVYTVPFGARFVFGGGLDVWRINFGFPF
jgi:hypothetical protein